MVAHAALTAQRIGWVTKRPARCLDRRSIACPAGRGPNGRIIAHATGYVSIDNHSATHPQADPEAHRALHRSVRKARRPLALDGRPAWAETPTVRPRRP